MPEQEKPIATDESNKSWMSLSMPTSVLITIAGILAVALLYYINVSHREAQFVRRAFRHLDLIGDEIALQTTNYYNAIANAPSNVDEQYVATFLSGVLYSRDNPRNYKENTIISEGDNYYLFLKLTPINGTNLFLKAPIPALFKDTRATLLSTDIFDDVLLAGQDGKIVFQLDRVGPQIVDIASLVSSATPSAPTKDTGDKSTTESPTQIHHFIETSSFSNLLDINLAGARYKLLLQPLHLRINNAESMVERPHYVLCGLIRADRLLTDNLQIPYTSIAWGLFTVLVLSLSLPFFKVLLIKPRERFSQSDAFRIILFLPILAFISTLCWIASIYAFRYDYTDNQLRQLATQISTHFSSEIHKAITQLEFFGKSNRLRTETHNLQPLDAVLAGRARGEPDILQTELTSYASDDVYPFFNSVFWMDAPGRHRILWTVRDKAPPLLNVSHRAYAKDLFEGRLLYLRLGQNQELPFTMEVINSWITGLNSIVICIPHDIGGAGMVIRPMSLMKTFLPTGLGYALINRDGLVLVHSEEPRNLVENFFEETSMNRQLIVASATGIPTFVDTPYHGKDYRLLVTNISQIEGLPLTLIVFKEKLSFRSTLINAISESGVGFSIEYALLCSVVYLLCGGRHIRLRKNMPYSYPLEWIWPNEELAGSYLRLFVGLVAIMGIALFVIAIHLNWLSILTCIIGSLGCLLYSIYIFRFNKSLHSDLLRKLAAVHWRKLYLGSAVMIITLIAVIPCVALFISAIDYEHVLTIKENEKAFAGFLDRRSNEITNDYRNVNFLTKDNRKEFLDIRLNTNKTALDLYQDYLTPIEVSESKSRPICKEKVAVLNDLLMHGLSTLRSSYGIGFTNSVALDSNWQWCETSDGSLQLVRDHYRSSHSLLLSVTSVSLFHLLSSPIWWIGATVLIIIFAWVLHITVERLFSFGSLPIKTHSDLPSLGQSVGNMLVLCDPFYREELGRIKMQESLAHVLDMATSACAENSFDLHYPQITEKGVVILDNFEAALDDERRCEEKLRLLERLVFEAKIRVTIISTIDPLPYFSDNNHIYSNGTGRTNGVLPIDRWAHVLTSFNKWYCGGIQKEQVKVLLHSGFDGTVIGTNSLIARETACAVMQKEAGNCPILLTIAAAMIEDLVADHIDIDLLIDEFRDRAAARYQLLWSSCSIGEKLLLIQLAQEGYINPNNKAVARNLLRRGLIVQTPIIKLFNESFRRFVDSAESPDRIGLWEQHGASRTWRALKIIFWIGVCGGTVFLLYTERGILESGIALLSATAGAIAVLLKAFDMLQKKRLSATQQPTE